jgi:UDP-N-acetylglucosamine diphosphorylase / glucose-1-phosphate thymidylyltransferase / UDP-N-acetylgalactosamine diphosphorylase / glucosamine-1-phosphate N-acetyltransferase / galactosamine-1-phosphate N-acetyltransferase
MNVILLATSQTRDCFPLTVNKPNALLKVFNKTLLEYAIDSASLHCEDITALISGEHFPLFKDSGLLERINYRIAGPGEELQIPESSMVLDCACYFPAAKSLSDTESGSFEIKYSWDLLSCQEKYANHEGGYNEGRIETGAAVTGYLSSGKGTVIKSGACLEGHIVIGENCIIGPNCYIRGFCAIGNNCRIGNAVEIKNSILGDNVNVYHLSYLGDSIIGNNINLGAGFISSNLRHDGAPVTTRLNGEKVNTKRRKLGVIIGDNVRTGINTSSYPGRKIWPGLNTLPGTIVDKDIEN